MTTSISSTGTSPVTTQGIGTGLDIAGIVDKLMALEQAPVTRLQNQEAAFQSKVSAYGSVSSALATFQTTVAALAVPTAFSSYGASVTDSTIAAVAIDPTQSSQLSAGSHTLVVNQLAASQRTASSAFATTATVVGTGSITIDTGTWAAGYSGFTQNGVVGSKTITIDASNNSLAGVRDAINAAQAGVSASIVNDGTGNRLVLTGAATGAANGFRVRTSDGTADDGTGLSQLAFDPSTSGAATQRQTLADAVDASFRIDGLAISKPTNHVTDAIAGLALDLNKVDLTGTAFTISRDTSAATKGVNDFVSAYNTIVTGFATLTAFDPTANTAGTLNGDSSIRLIKSRLQSLITSVVPTGGSITSLIGVGIKMGADGTLTVDSAKLSSALASDPDAVGRLFAKTGTPTDASVSYSASTDATQAGSHALTVSQLATRGSLVGSTAPATTTITAGSNDTFTVTIDNVTSTVTIPAGSYSASTLATAVQATINGTSAFSNVGSSVVVSTDGSGVMAITSQRFGSGSSVAIGGGNGASNLFGATPTSTGGLDVAGTIDGTAFIGSGQTAIGATGSTAEGLRLSITGGGTGSRGTVTLTRGVAAGLNDLLTQFLDPATGVLGTQTDSYNKSIANLKLQEADWTPRLAATRARLTAQYNAMDALVAQMNSTSSYLTQQITAIQSMTNGINSGK